MSSWMVSNLGRNGMDDDLDAVIGAVAAKHNILVDRDDPVVMIPTLIKIGIERAVRDLTSDEQARKDAMRAFILAVQMQSLKSIEAEGTAIAARIREAVQLDLDRAGASAATLVSNLHQAHSRKGQIRSMTFGMLVAGLLLGAGVCIGKYLL